MNKRRNSRLDGGRSIVEIASNAKWRVGFVAEALNARQQILESDKAFDGEEFHAYLTARINNRNATKSAAKSWRMQS